jgi:hypothetical protein
MPKLNLALFEPLTRSSKPAGKLDPKTASKEYKKLHEDLISIRDRTFVQSDASAAAIPGEISNDLRFRRACYRMWPQMGDRLGSFVTRFLIEPSYLQSMLPLLDRLIEITDEQTQRLCGKLAKQVPKAEGQYAVNVSDPNGPLFTKPDKMVDDIRHSDF